MSTQRYFIELAYDGTEYGGWQIQPNAVTVQGKLNEALFQILGLKTWTIGSGRTDAGVHCRRQFAHFEFGQIDDLKRLAHQLNAVLPPDIGVIQIRRAIPEGHARFHALGRTYRYQITQQKNPLLARYAWLFYPELDIESMNAAAALLMTHSNFECFAKLHGGSNSFECDIRDARWTRQEYGYMFFIKADRFLRGMVRFIVGTMVAVGTGKHPVEYVETLLKNGQQPKIPLAPPNGLCLYDVEYPESIFMG